MFTAPALTDTTNYLGKLNIYIGQYTWPTAGDLEHQVETKLLDKILQWMLFELVFWLPLGKSFISFFKLFFPRKD